MNPKKVFLLLAGAGLMLPTVFLSASPIPFEIPQKVGHVQDYFPAKKTNAPLLILLQDAHTHYDAQKSLAEILKYLVLDHNLHLVMVEGGAGDVDLSYLRQGVPAEHVKEVAEHYLQEGKISGEEYLDLTLEDGDFQIWGVEDSRLYAQNMEAYLSFADHQSKAIEEIAILKEELRNLKIKYFPPDLYDLEVLRERAKKNEASVIEYFSSLQKKIDPAFVPAKDYPEFFRWVKVQKLQEQLDGSKVDLEKDELIHVLSQLATKEELYPIQQALKTSGGDSEAVLYRAIIELKKNYEHQLSRYSSEHLKQALRIIQASQALDGGKLFDEADQIYIRLRNREIAGAEGQKILAFSDYVELVERLFRLEWTPRDELAFRQLLLRWRPPSVSSLIQSKVRIEQIEEWVSNARQFYEIAAIREKAILGNVVSKIKDLDHRRNSLEALPVYVLIVGGYHAQTLAREFQSKGISVLSVIPQFEVTDKPAPYFQVLREKWGNGDSWRKAPSLHSPSL